MRFVYLLWPGFPLQLYTAYDDDDIGALDHEDIDGKVSTGGPMMEYLLEQFDKQQVAE